MSVLLALVTNDPLEASMHLLGCPADRLPRWVRVYSDPDTIRAIPNGAKVYAYFVKKNMFRLPQELALEERRARGGCQFGLTAEESEKLLKMKRERAAREVVAHMTARANEMAGTDQTSATE